MIRLGFSHTEQTEMRNLLPLAALAISILSNVGYAQNSNPVDASKTEGSNPDMAAAKELVALGIPFTQAEFEKAVASGDLNAIQLFFRAGYSPNGIANSGGDFVFDVALRNNRRNISEELDLFAKNGLEFKRVYSGSGGEGKILSDLLHRPITQEEDLLYTASKSSVFGETTAELTAKIKTLIAKGADKTSLVKSITKLQHEGGLPPYEQLSYKLLVDAGPTTDGVVEANAATAPDFSLAGLHLGMSPQEAIHVLKDRKIEFKVSYGILPSGRNGPISVLSFTDINNGGSYLGRALFSKATGKMMALYYRDQSGQREPLLRAAIAKWGAPKAIYSADQQFWGDIHGEHLQYQAGPVGGAIGISLILEDSAAEKASSDFGNTPDPQAPKL